jgi:hypothetical protein
VQGPLDDRAEDVIGDVEVLAGEVVPDVASELEWWAGDVWAVLEPPALALPEVAEPDVSFDVTFPEHATSPTARITTQLAGLTGSASSFTPRSCAMSSSFPGVRSFVAGSAQVRDQIRLVPPATAAPYC